MESFKPPAPLRNRHVQSVLGSVPPRTLLVRRRAARLRRCAQQWLLDCGDDVVLEAFYSLNPAPAAVRRLAMVLHGWEGSAESSYVLSLATLLFDHGFDVVRLNLRDHGATHHLNREIFHSCRLSEVVGAVRAVAERLPMTPFYLAGFSLGGNFVLRLLAEMPPPAPIVQAVAISPVIDPAVTLTALERGWSVYRRHFVGRWSRSLRRKQRLWPVHDFTDMLRLADLRGMTAGLVERCTDFPDLDAYLQGYAITGERLAQLSAPAAVLLSEDDPIIPAADAARMAASPRLTVTRTHFGGHCGFIGELGAPTYADRFVLRQFAART